MATKKNPATKKAAKKTTPVPPVATTVRRPAPVATPRQGAGQP